MDQTVTNLAFLTSALVFDIQEDRLLGSVTADKAIPDFYPPNRYHFYCGDCLDQGHAMRLVRLPQEKKKSKILPPRYRHHEHARATHACDHPVRTKRLDKLAQRYNAVVNNEGGYIFSLSLARQIEEADRVVDTAKRLAKITQALLYDPELRSKQKLRFGDFQRSFEGGLYTASPHDKLRLFRESLEFIARQEAFRAAVIFRPIGHRGKWKEFAGELGIPGYAAAVVKEGRLKGQPSTILKFVKEDLYHAVASAALKMDKERNRKSVPLMVYGQARQDGLRTIFDIQSIDQVAKWNGPLGFEEVSKVQKKVQRDAPEALFKPQMALL